ncbi:hypothetical protein PAECIP111892_03147 [Paenibacillus auburnensis]|uniref:DUF2339 domain-containing protein n=1 Tax=Paenibacillus auburnensis TaxID=2905649 RepID=A0ABM9CD14_9BACL|nr:DUF2339 domain-containing protein [Paenibacillus auburnensis]CAH1208632.1 hypothetical protein PAECIP111892_03147 [Paenibacillus auburnensis]
MEQFKDRLRAIKEQQDVLLGEYQELIKAYEGSDLVNENEALKKRAAAVEQALAETEAQGMRLKQENAELRTALTEQILDEKLGILRLSRRKLHTYFAAQSAAQHDRLTAFELRTKQRIAEMYRTADRLLGKDSEEIRTSLEALSARLNESILLRRAELLEAERPLAAEVDHRLDELASEGVSEETIRRRRRQNRIEMKIGLNWINRLGILLLILAVGAGFKYSYSTWFTGYMKGSAFFLLGALMLGGGEWLFRRGRGTFALGLLGGGVSVLYGSIFYSYFLLEIIGIYPGLALSVLVTLTAVLLSLRYESRTICSMGLVGGYLPLFSYIFAFGLEGGAVYAAMGYLFLLNLLIVLISLRKRWIVVNYISFLFNTPSMLLLINLSDSYGINMFYSILTFAMYLGITLWYPFKYRTKLSWWDFALLACNTMTSCLILYVLFLDAGLGAYKGALALAFCLLYLGLGRLLEKMMGQEKESMLLFYATSLTFAVLMIPFQLGTVWWSIGWLVEAVVLTVYGHLQRFKAIERIGWGILLLSLALFFFIDVLMQSSSAYSVIIYDNPYFALKYTFITAGMLVVTLVYAIRHSRREILLASSPAEVQAGIWFKYAALVNTYAYILYESLHLYNLYVPEEFTRATFYRMLLSAVLTLGLAYALPKIKVLYDATVAYMVYFLYAIGYVICLALTTWQHSLKVNFSDNTAADYAALGLLILFNLFVWQSGGRLLKTLLKREYNNEELYPVVMGVYLLAIVTAFLGVQLRQNDGGLIFSLTYLLLAVLFIMFGFRRRYVYIRRFGLALSLLATGKLLLYDLMLLNTGSKIIAYFSFGLCLLGISYLYQRVSARMEEVYAEAKQDSPQD